MMEKQHLKALKTGSEQAFNQIYLKYFALIKQICFNFVRRNDVAEDLSIDTFVKLWNTKDKIDVSKNFKYYLITIAKNTCKDYLRKLNKEQTSLTDENTLEILNYHHQEQEQIKDCESLNLKIKEHIDSESFEILVLHYEHQLKYKEIAKIKQMTTSQVTNKASRALRKLKEVFKYE